MSAAASSGGSDDCAKHARLADGEVLLRDAIHRDAWNEAAERLQQVTGASDQDLVEMLGHLLQAARQKHREELRLAFGHRTLKSLGEKTKIAITTFCSCLWYSLPGIALPSGIACPVRKESLHKPGLGRQTLQCRNVVHENWPLCRKQIPDLTFVEDLTSKAHTLFARQQFAECARIASQAFDLQSRNADIKIFLGHGYLHGFGFDCDLQKAEELLTDAYHQGHHLAPRLLGFLNVAKGQVSEATKFYDEAFHKFDDVRAVDLASHLHGLTGRLEDARSFRQYVIQRGMSPTISEDMFLELLEIDSHISQSTTFVESWINNRVILHGLKSKAGEPLNGHLGTVVSHDKKANRFVVGVDGVGKRAFELKNLASEHSEDALPSSAITLGAGNSSDTATATSSLGLNAQISSDLLRSHDEELLHYAILLSIAVTLGGGGSSDVATATNSLGLNGPISSDLLRSHDEEHLHYAILLRFSRSPSSFYEALRSSELLAPYHQNLHLPSQSTMAFLRPEHYEPVLESIRKQGVKLQGSHVIVEPELEEEVVARLKGVTKLKKGQGIQMILYGSTEKESQKESDSNGSQKKEGDTHNGAADDEQQQQERRRDKREPPVELK
jgi:hypothetical protein